MTEDKPSSASADSAQQNSPARDAAREAAVRKAWTHGFRPEFIIRLQHDVVALSAVLDKEFLANQPATSGASAGTNASANPDPDLPSEAIRAVKLSIEFWRRAVEKELCATCPGNSAQYLETAKWSRHMRIALTKQVDLWQTLITGQQSLRAFTTESLARHLMQSVWNEVQDEISTDFVKNIGQARTAAANLAHQATEAIETVFKEAVQLFWPIAGLFIVVAVTFLIASFVGGEAVFKGASSAVGLTGLGSIAAMFFKRNQLVDTKDEQKAILQKKGNEVASQAMSVPKGSTTGAQSASAGPTAGILAGINSAAHSAANDVMAAFERGFAQIEVELEGLNRSVGVSYPLVDYFATNLRTGQTAVSFLTEIVWTGEERVDEMKSIMRAALGPFALFAFAASAQDAGSTEDLKAPSVTTDTELQRATVSQYVKHAWQSFRTNWKAKDSSDGAKKD